MERYEAKRAVIIGGTSGMGLATAKMLRDGSARAAGTEIPCSCWSCSAWPPLGMAGGTIMKTTVDHALMRGLVPPDR